MTNASGLTHKNEKTVGTLGYNGRSVRTFEVVVLITQCAVYLGATMGNHVCIPTS